MAGLKKQLKDFKTVENKINGNEYVFVSQNGNTRKTTINDVKNFAIGTEDMGTSATTIKGAIKEHEEGINNIVTQLNENTNEISNIKTDYAKKTDVNDLASNKADKIELQNTNLELETQKSRIDSFTKLVDGSTTGDAELQDIRVGVDGISYENAGTSVRTQFKNIINGKSDNLFVSSNPNEISGTIANGSALINVSPSNKIIYIPCEGNSVYEIVKNSITSIFIIATTSEVPNENIDIIDRTTIVDSLGKKDSSLKKVTLTTSSEAKYLIVQCYNTTNDASITKEEVYSSISIKRVVKLNDISLLNEKINNISDNSLIIKNDNIAVCKSMIKTGDDSANTLDVTSEGIIKITKKQIEQNRTCFALKEIKNNCTYIVKLIAKSNAIRSINIFLYAFQNYAITNVCKKYKQAILKTDYSIIELEITANADIVNTNESAKTLSVGFSTNDLTNIDDYVEFLDVEVYKKEDYKKISNSKIETASISKDKLSFDVPSNPTPVIFDTDWWTDIDDAVAIRTLLWAERTGMVDIVGICLDAVSDTSIQSLDSFLNFEGRSGLCIGADKEATGYGGTPSYHDTIISTWSYKDYSSIDECDDCVTFYRKSLSSLPDNEKAIIIIVGFQNAFSKLLNSNADDYSWESGIELVKRKVEKIYVMGGAYGHASGTAENNFSRTQLAIDSASNVMNKCPVPIIYLGAEVGTPKTGGNLKDTTKDWDLLYKIFGAFKTDTGEDVITNGRNSWDPMLTLLACYNDADVAGYNLIRGTNSIDASTGVNTFTNSDSGNHYYVTKKYDNSKYAYEINSILEKKSWPYRKLGRVQLKK